MMSKKIILIFITFLNVSIAYGKSLCSSDNKYILKDEIMLNLEIKETLNLNSGKNSYWQTIHKTFDVRFVDEDGKDVLRSDQAILKLAYLDKNFNVVNGTYKEVVLTTKNCKK